MDAPLVRAGFRFCWGVAVMLAGLVTGYSAERWLDQPLPVAIASNAPTIFDLPGIPVLKPAP